MSPAARVVALEARRLLRARGLVAASLILVAAGAYAAWHGADRAHALAASVATAEEAYHDRLAHLLQRHPDGTEAGELLYYLAFPAAQAPGRLSALSQGQGDVQGTNLQLRLLALEGQLYENEISNPRVAATGRLDLAFVLVFLLPLLVIALTYDLVSGEREGGTWDLARLHGRPEAVIRMKLAARGSLVAVVVGALVGVGAVAARPEPVAGVWAVAVVATHTAFWFGVCLFVVSRGWSSATNALALAGSWVVLGALVPAALALASALLHPVPEALELTVLQRQGYHESWDRPRSETMEAFASDYPRWSGAPVPEDSFSWAWYYAMNNRGDQAARKASLRYRQALAERHAWARRWSVLAPPLAAQLALDGLAGSDLGARLEYQDRVRRYHEALKIHFHPILFSGATVAEVDWALVPHFQDVPAAPPASPPVKETVVLLTIAVALVLLAGGATAASSRLLAERVRRCPAPVRSATLGITALALAVPAATAQEVGVFRVGSAVAEPGSSTAGVLDVAGSGEEGTALPVTVIHGRSPGPVLAVVAGVHGSEYVPIVAASHLPSRVSAGELRGTVVVVHLANPPAFFGRTVYVSPADGKNLNRVFPGNPEGTLTERIAHALTTRILGRADYVIDVHAGDANEDLRPYTGYYGAAGSPAVIARSRAMAVAFGLEHVVRFPQQGAEAEIYTGGTAVLRGRPAMDVEVGGAGRGRGEEVEWVLRGILSVLHHLEMLPGPPPAPPADPVVEIVERSSARSPLDGLFQARVRPGEWVARGMALGVVRDLHGLRERVVSAPASGVLLSILATPAVRQDEWVATVGHLPGRDDP